MKPNTSAASARKPRVALAIGTAFGLGYLPRMPGTWGSLGGVGLMYLLAVCFVRPHDRVLRPMWRTLVPLTDSSSIVVVAVAIVLTAIISVVGVWAAERVAAYLKDEDPQEVVIDEVSGVMLALLLGFGLSVYWGLDGRTRDFGGFGSLFLDKLLNWKYLLAGLILFRVFDIWKPFPVRRAESLPGGWGIMADDWIAGVYAALGYWGLRALGF